MKKYFWLGLRLTGVLWFWRSLQPNSVTILMLHGVVNSKTAADWKPSWDRISADWLDHCLSVFSKSHEFISLTDAVRILTAEEKIKKNYLVLTFDDGYRNNLTHALPILQKHQVSPIFFVVTSHITNRTVYWIDRLDYALQQVDLREREFTVGKQVFRAESNNYRDVRRLHFLLRRAIKAEFDDQQMNKWLDTICGEIEEQCGRSLEHAMETDPYAAVLSWQELKEAKSEGVEIGSHTTEHQRLTRVSTDVARQSLTNSKSEIERRLEADCLHFCYPNGDVNSVVEQWVEQAGYISGITCESGRNYAGENVFRLKRLSFPQEGLDDNELVAFIIGCKQVLLRLSQRIRPRRRR